MRAPPRLLLRWLPRTPPLRLLGGVLEVLLAGGGVALIEAIGPHAADDGADVVGLLVLAVLVGAFGLLSPAFPLSGGAVRALRRAGRSLVERLAPTASLSFRLPPGPPPAPLASIRAPLLLLGTGTVAVLLAGQGLWAGLLAVRNSVSYTLYLLLLGLVWGWLAGVVVLGLLSSAHALGLAERRRPPWRVTLDAVALLALWVGLLLALVRLPGLVPFLALLLTASWPLLRRRGRSARRYWLCRIDAEGRLRASTAEGFLLGRYALLSLVLLFAGALAHGPRLLAAASPGGAFGLTHALGLVAGVGALFAAARASRLLLGLLAPPGGLPEEPLCPRLWWPGGAPSGAGLASLPEAGWSVRIGTRPPRGGYDLVAGRTGDPRSWVARGSLAEEGEQFRLWRRFHVVQRRAFLRRLEGLWKVSRGPEGRGAQGFLLCPHVWCIPGLLADGEPASAEGRAPTALGATLIGGPFARVFPPRVRRYAGGVLRSLDLDGIYWEAGVGWPALRSVFGILFEIHDQERGPARDGDFVGLPRLRVLVQAPEEDEGTAGSGPPAPGLRARILVVRRDDGGAGEEWPHPSPSHRIRPPVPVGA